jgi:sphinganine C4-monooxygenase
MNQSAPSWDWQLNRTTSLGYPVYFKNRSELIPNIPDHALVLVVPLIAYWSYSLLFHLLDISEWTWLDKYRIHDSAEVKSRNLASRSQVLYAVIFQQVLQTVLGYWWMGGAEDISAVDHASRLRSLSPTVRRVLLSTIGESLTQSLMEQNGAEVVHFVYWWAIPIAQLLFAM